MHEDLHAIGQVLQEAREAQGLSLADVEARTKIAASVLEALETGDSSRLPHPAYARGFLRSYATILGLDPAPLLARFAQAYPIPQELEEAPEERAAQIRVTVRGPGSEPFGPWPMWLAGGVALIVLAVGGWFGFRWYILPQVAKLREVASAVSHAPNATSAVPSEAFPSPSGNASAAGAMPSEGSSGAHDNASSPREEKSTSTQGVPGHGSSSTDVAGKSQESPATIVSPAPSRVMRVEAVANSWLQAKIDDKVTDYFLRKGETVDIAFTSTLTLKVGNAAGVRLHLDGRLYPLDNPRVGEVRTITVR
jgi:cytoskeleton protein RodZ